MNMVAEGYYAAKTVNELYTSKKTRTPIIDAVHAVLYEDKNPKKVFKKLADKLD